MLDRGAEDAEGHLLPTAVEDIGVLGSHQLGFILRVWSGRQYLGTYPNSALLTRPRTMQRSSTLTKD